MTAAALSTAAARRAWDMLLHARRNPKPGPVLDAGLDITDTEHEA
jgi:hypothetical protein